MEFTVAIQSRKLPESSNLLILGRFRRALNGRLLSVCLYNLAWQERRIVQTCQSIGFAGEAILRLLHKAAGAAKAHSRQALETAQKLSSQLRAAEDRIAELEAEVHLYREKSEHAEEWLRKISMEIEDRLVK